MEYFFPVNSFANAVKDIVSPLYSTLRSSTTFAVMLGSLQYVILEPTGIWHLVKEKFVARSVLSVSISCAVCRRVLFD